MRIDLHAGAIHDLDDAIDWYEEQQPSLGTVFLREVYLALKAAIDTLDVPANLQARLGAIVEVALTSGRVRRLFGPGAELSLNSLFMKTPRGREVAASLAELNKALASLKGRTVEQITSTQRSPGAYALTLKTSGCQIVIRFEQAGVRVESLEVDLGS